MSVTVCNSCSTAGPEVVEENGATGHKEKRALSEHRKKTCGETSSCSECECVTCGIDLEKSEVS